MPDRHGQFEADSWYFFPLVVPEEMSLANISKLVLASHPRSSALVIYPNKRPRFPVSFRSVTLSNSMHCCGIFNRTRLFMLVQYY